jgi:hypothetical protein
MIAYGFMNFDIVDCLHQDTSESIKINQVQIKSNTCDGDL